MTRSIPTLKLAAFAAVVPAVLAAAAASAVTVEPDDFTAGTDISTAVDGVTLSTSGSLVFGAGAGGVFAETPPTGPGVSSTGDLVFGYQNGSQRQTNFTQGFLTATLRGDFDVPATQVTLDAIGNNVSGGNDSGLLRGFDADNNLLDSDTVSGLSRGMVGSLSIESDDGFAYFTFTGGNNAGANADNLSFTPVPEPATVGLLAAAGLGLLRRRPA